MTPEQQTIQVPLMRTASALERIVQQIQDRHGDQAPLAMDVNGRYLLAEPLSALANAYAALAALGASAASIVELDRLLPSLDADSAIPVGALVYNPSPDEILAYFNRQWHRKPRYQAQGRTMCAANHVIQDGPHAGKTVWCNGDHSSGWHHTGAVPDTGEHYSWPLR